MLFRSTDAIGSTERQRVFSNLEERAAAIFESSGESKYWKIPVALEGNKLGILKVSKTLIQITGFLGLTIVLTMFGFWLIPEDPQKSTVPKNRDTMVSVSTDPKAIKKNIKGRGTIRSIDVEYGSIQTNGDRGEFSIQFDDLANIDHLRVGQKVKFVGQFVDKDSSEVVHVKGKFIFEIGRAHV